MSGTRMLKIFKFTCPQCSRDQEVEIEMQKSLTRRINIGKCRCSGCAIELEISAYDIYQEWAQATISPNLDLI